MTCLHTHLAVLTPIDYNLPDGSRKKLRNLEGIFDRDNWGAIITGVLKHCPMIHMCRFQIVDHVFPGMGSSSPDRLKSKYLLFIAEIDGSADELYDHLYRFPEDFSWTPEDDGEFVREIWGNCRGFPNERGPGYFRRYMRRFEIDPSIQFAAAEGACVREIIDALLIQRTWALLSALPGVPTKVTSIDTDGQILDVDKSLARRLGYRRKEMLGKPLADFVTAESADHLFSVLLPKLKEASVFESERITYLAKSGEDVHRITSWELDSDPAGAIDNVRTAAKVDLFKTLRIIRTNLPKVSFGQSLALLDIMNFDVPERDIGPLPGELVKAVRELMSRFGHLSIGGPGNFKLRFDPNG